MNCIVGLFPQDLLSCFIFGLKLEIRCVVLARQPSSLSQASGITRLHEEKPHDILRLKKHRPSPPWQKPLSSRPISLFLVKSASNFSQGKPNAPPLQLTPPSKTYFC